MCGMRRLLVFVGACCLGIGACGVVPPIPRQPNVVTTTTTECQDHELPCAGSTTVPTLDPAGKDESVIDETIRSSSTSVRALLPRSS